MKGNRGAEACRARLATGQTSREAGTVPFREGVSRPYCFLLAGHFGKGLQESQSLSRASAFSYLAMAVALPSRNPAFNPLIKKAWLTSWLISCLLSAMPCPKKGRAGKPYVFILWLQFYASPSSSTPPPLCLWGWC